MKQDGYALGMGRAEEVQTRAAHPALPRWARHQLEAIHPRRFLIVRKDDDPFCPFPELVGVCLGVRAGKRALNFLQPEHGPYSAIAVPDRRPA